MQFYKNSQDQFRILQLPSTASGGRRCALTLRPILFRRRRRRRRDKRKKMTGRAKRKPKSSQVNLHCFHYLGWAAGTSSFVVLYRASDCAVCGYNGDGATWVERCGQKCLARCRSSSGQTTTWQQQQQPWWLVPQSLLFTVVHSCRVIHTRF